MVWAWQLEGLPTAGRIAVGLSVSIVHTKCSAPYI